MTKKTNSKPCQTSEIGLFRQLLTGTETNSESCQAFTMERLFLLTMINLKSVMEVFIYFGISIAKSF